MNDNAATPMEPTRTSSDQVLSKKHLLQFLIPSALGILIFMTPMMLNGKLTVLVAYLIDIINAAVKDYMLVVSFAVAVIPAIVTVIVSLNQRLRANQNKFVQLFNPGLIWTLMRVLGAITMILVYFKLGPEWVWHRNTGGVMLLDVAPVLLTIYFLSAFLLPLLTEYGLMEFIGTLFSKVFSIVFKLPGRAAIDSVASWLAASSVGILLTTAQYRAGHYTKREAAIIATNFSIVSIAFSYVVLKFIKLEQLFIPWYLSVAVAGVVCAIIIPRITPLKNIDDSYALNADLSVDLEVPRNTGESIFNWALRNGVERAKKADPIMQQFSKSFHLAADVAITVYPALLLIGVLGLALIEYTSVFQVLAMPLIPLLELLQLPEAPAAATAILSGVVDMLMPAILGAGIESELTRFVVAGIAVNGIIFFTEVAVVMIRANIGLNIINLLVIWLLRLLISLPVLTVMGHLVIG